MLLFPILACAASGRCAVVPNELANAEGNGASLAPFGIVGTNASMRYQQVYDASQFLKEPDGGWITDMYFRVDATSGYGFAATLQRIQINLSTTTKAPDELSPVFRENAGIDDTIVVGPGQLKISGGGNEG